ncbi:MAG: hypothetical protein C0507_03975 [Cyanobacteria bacterium PR.3.49]|nr:hypothetical protein [Cyanobacteria bacterium PR.3.49]
MSASQHLFSFQLGSHESFKIEVDNRNITSGHRTMPVSMTGSGFATTAGLPKLPPAKSLARWQTAGLHPECYSPQRRSRAMQATDVFYKILGILWLLTIVVFYAYMVVCVR